jgi:hypothetical protein
MPANPPLILTCLINQEAFDFFNALRKNHFPPERNFLDAHLTLFHHLPAEEPDIMQAVGEACMQYPPVVLEVKEVVFTGKGVAYRMESPALKKLHHALQQRWKQWLIPQDRQGLWPHITVQNKVYPGEARLLQKELSAGFTPFEAMALGLSVWEYQGGPWGFRESFLFQGTR